MELKALNVYQKGRCRTVRFKGNNGTIGEGKLDKSSRDLWNVGIGGGGGQIEEEGPCSRTPIMFT